VNAEVFENILANLGFFWENNFQEILMSFFHFPVLDRSEYYFQVNNSIILPLPNSDPALKLRII
jgi:hypothetical protein